MQIWIKMQFQALGQKVNADFVEQQQETSTKASV